MCLGAILILGNKDNKGLLPNDFDDQQSKPEVSWQKTKTGFSKYINGHGGGVGKTAKNYVKASGGTEGLLKSSKSGIRGAVNIGRLFSDIQQHGYQKTFDELGIEYKGNMGKKGLKEAPNKKTFEELSQSSTVTSHKLRLRLLEEGIKEHKCECCGMWKRKSFIDDELKETKYYDECPIQRKDAE